MIRKLLTIIFSIVVCMHTFIIHVMGKFETKIPYSPETVNQEDFVLIGQWENKLFYQTRPRTSFDEAKSTCRSANMTMIKPQSSEERTEIYNGIIGYEWFWVDASLAGELYDAHSNYEWYDSKAPIDRSIKVYQGREYTLCVYINFDRDWIVSTCGEGNIAVCELTV